MIKKDIASYTISRLNQERLSLMQLHEDSTYSSHVSKLLSLVNRVLEPFP